MGEIADGMIDGTFDSFTGEYLGEGPGYPRTADKSLPWERKPIPHERNWDVINANWKSPHVTAVFTALSECGVKGKATRRAMLKSFIVAHYGDNQYLDEIPTLCILIGCTPGALQEFKQYIKRQNQASEGNNQTEAQW